MSWGMRDRDSYIPCEPDNHLIIRRKTSFFTSTQEIKNMRASSQFFTSFVSLENASRFLVLSGFKFSWLGMRDSNPRMAGPEPAALPLGESPTARFIISCLAKASQYSYLTIYIF